MEDEKEVVGTPMPEELEVSGTEMPTEEKPDESEE